MTKGNPYMGLSVTQLEAVLEGITDTNTLNKVRSLIDEALEAAEARETLARLEETR